ncbi:MAG: hypothetical protein BWZ07_00478 [Alphaproteobacteria bacterium ADurb.BinA280]|nr:MAG: hypothetical protein BWZ07_00478 [Alphaproteobacteria bacterium ADurb.BinA280]
MTQFVNEDGVGLGQQFGKLGFDFPQNAHSKAGTRKGMAIHHFARQTELHAQTPHFILEQFTQWFDQAEFHVLGQSTNVVMALDNVRFARLAAR